nr:protein phosphatase methylesterase 1-like isoform X1 [Coffea arabica]
MMESSAPSNLAPLSEESPPAETSARDCSNNPPDHNNINDEVPSAFSSVPARPPIQTSSQKYAPLDWAGYFDREDDVSIPGSNDVFHVYLAGTQGPVIFCLHGGGYTGLSFALSASKIKEKVRVVAMDFRGHGKSSTENELDLSIETLCSDVLAVLKTMYGDSPPAIVLVGHSMGGSVAVHVAARKQLPTLCGLVVVDVVEGTAMASLIHMQKILTNRMQHFPTIEKAIEWSVKGGSLRNIESARVSIPSTLIYDDSKRCYTYRAKLEETEQHWRGWYEGLSEKFLSSPVPKLLLLAGTDRLDRFFLFKSTTFTRFRAVHDVLTWVTSKQLFRVALLRSTAQIQNIILQNQEEKATGFQFNKGWPCAPECQLNF